MKQPLSPIQMYNRAFHKIQLDPVLWKQWNSAKDPIDRDMIIIAEIMSLTYQIGFEAGFDHAAN
jgi:hypothetical protein